MKDIREELNFSALVRQNYSTSWGLLPRMLGTERSILELKLLNFTILAQMLPFEYTQLNRKKIQKHIGQWWCTSLNPVLRRQRKVDLRVWGLVYRVSSSTGRATYTEKPCSENQPTNQTNTQISIMSPKKTSPVLEYLQWGCSSDLQKQSRLTSSQGSARGTRRYLPRASVKEALTECAIYSWKLQF